MKWHGMMTIIAGLGVAGVAGAHAHLRSSVPANHSIEQQTPQQLVLRFNEAVQLTALTIQRSDDPAKKLEPLPTAPTQEVSVKLPALAAGNYVVRWRALSDDGHIVADKLAFAVAAALPGRGPAK